MIIRPEKYIFQNWSICWKKLTKFTKSSGEWVDLIPRLNIFIVEGFPLEILQSCRL